MPTATTIPLLLLIIILWRCTRGHLLAMVMFVSVFDAASALNFGGVGMAPWLFTLAIGLGAKLLLTGYRRLRISPGANRVSLHLFAAFVLYVVASAAVFPLIFHGIRVGYGDASETLGWRFSNFAQTFYLLAASLVYLMATGSSNKDLNTVLKWYVRGCIVASLVAMYQLANGITHIPYPSAVFYSNPSYTIYPAYKINGIWRLNGPFCEASDMAGSLVPGFALLGWELVTQKIRFWRLMSFLLMLLSLLLTISSTGYLCLIAIVVSGFALIGLRVRRRGLPSRGRVLVAFLLLTGLIGFTTLNPSGLEIVNKITDSTLTQKTSSDSYRVRVMTDATAMRILGETYYIGAGWGSTRASGLGYVLLGTVGVIGLVLFLAFCGSLLGGFRVRAPMDEFGLPDDLYERTLYAVSFLLLSLFLAGSEPVTPMLWIMFGIATVARPMRRFGIPQPQLAGSFEPARSPFRVERPAVAPRERLLRTHES